MRGLETKGGRACEGWGVGGSGLGGVLGALGVRGLRSPSSECVKAREIRLRRQTEVMINFSCLHTVSSLSNCCFSPQVQCGPGLALLLGCKERMSAGSEQGAGSQGAGRRGRLFHQIQRWNLLAGMQ